ncbi:hypothetical protein NA57DRAFT_81946 [Rhizodiscina lignyota]|uniref:Uncharacterized protein n=1 Tax=Rhizodiscina lignyota TaxID=1504668 RepID=A0A9P4I4G3_9PEZI|nr:hypothetical protein NA57DRAFT_81946 [Rhizodiscina lignyota]
MMLDKLHRLRKSTLSQVRRIRTLSYKLHVRDPQTHNLENGTGCHSFGLARILQLLPGLHLDTLTVFARDHDEEIYDLEEMLLLAGGWRELRFILAGPVALHMSMDLVEDRLECWDGHYTLQNMWEEIFSSSDECTAHPSVDIYKCNKPQPYGCILGPAQRHNYEVLLPDFGYSALFDSESDGEHLVIADGRAKQWNWIRDERRHLSNGPVEEQKKEVMVVATRGTGDDYKQTDEPMAYDDEGMRSIYCGLSWWEIKHLYVDDEFSISQAHVHDARRPRIPQLRRATYEDPEEYDWSDVLPLEKKPCFACD